MSDTKPSYSVVLRFATEEQLRMFEEIDPQTRGSLLDMSFYCQVHCGIVPLVLDVWEGVVEGGEFTAFDVVNLPKRMRKRLRFPESL